MTKPTAVCPGSQLATGVAETSSGQPIVVGYFTPQVDFGGGALTSAGSLDAFVAGFDEQGDYRWSARAGDAAAQRLNGIAHAESDDSFVVAGLLQSTAKWGACSAQTSQGGNDVWLTWLDGAGNCLRSARFGDDAQQSAVAVAAGKGSSTLFAVAGRFSGTLDVGGSVLQADGEDAFVALFAGDRQTDALVPAWARRIGDAGPQLGLAFDAQDNVVVVGEYQGEDASAGLRASGGGHDAFAIKYDISGNRLWSKSFGGAGEQIAYGVGTDATGHVYVAGGFAGDLPLSSGTLTSAGGDDIFVLKLAP